MRACEVCGQEFAHHPNRPDQRMCSRSCRQKRYRLARKAERLQPKPCAQCDVDFTPVTGRQVYCSGLCQGRARIMRQFPLPAEATRDCAHCGLPYEVTAKTSHRRRYCSDECKRAFATRVQQGIRWRHVGRRYGLAPAAFDAMFAEQGGACAICDIPLNGKGLERDSPQVDHDHKTGSLRAILCRPCNTALGMFRDDPALVDRAAQYLRSWAARSSVGTPPRSAK